jgi:hypothetical protein
MDRADHQPPGVPAWVKAMAIVAAILVVLVVVMMAVAGGEHGPSRHGGHGTVDLPPATALT